MQEAGPQFCCLGCALAFDVSGGAAAGEVQGLSAANLLQARLFLSGFFAMNLMIFATVNYARHLYPQAMAEEARLWAAFDNLINWITLLFTLPIVALLLPPMIQNALRAMRARRADADYLVVLAVLSALGLSLASTLLGRGPVYFESVGLLLVLITLGRLWEARFRVQTLRRLKSLTSAHTETLTVETGDGADTGLTEKPLTEITPGMVVHVGQGQTLFVDGVLEQGDLLVDKSVSTGESHPVAVAVGEELVALVKVLHGAGRLRVTRVGEDSFAGRMACLISQAEQTRTRGQRMLEQLASWFTPLLLLLGLGAFFFRLPTGLGPAAQAMLSVWLVGCPCALTLATPLALAGVLGALAQRGVLIRDMEVLEDLNTIKAVFLDKTRTLTRFEPVIRQSWFHGISEEMAAVLTRSVEAGASHPLAAVLRSALKGEVFAVTQITEHAARGLAARVLLPQGETPVLLGAVDFVLPPEHNQARQAASEMAATGLRVVAGRAGDGVWLYGLGETLHPHAQAVVDTLKQQGLPVVILSGDDPARVQDLARGLGIGAEGALTAQDKMARVQAAGVPALMVGDGLNDAVALKAARVGVAVRCGADLVREAARVLVLGDDLRVLLMLKNAGGVARSRVWLALGWVFVYNLVGVALALAGWLNPLVAALMMVMSSATLTVGSLLSGLSLEET